MMIELTDSQKQDLIDLLCRIIKTEKGMDFILTLTNSPSVQSLIEKLVDASD